MENFRPHFLCCGFCPQSCCHFIKFHALGEQFGHLYRNATGSQDEPIQWGITTFLFLFYAIHMHIHTCLHTNKSSCEIPALFLITYKLQLHPQDLFCWPSKICHLFILGQYNAYMCVFADGNSLPCCMTQTHHYTKIWALFDCTERFAVQNICQFQCMHEVCSNLTIIAVYFAW